MVSAHLILQETTKLFPNGAVPFVFLPASHQSFSQSHILISTS